MTSILVLGAGELGEAVFQHLATHPRTLETGASIALLLRPSTIHTPSAHHLPMLERAKALGIRLVTGDVVSLSEHELADILRPFHTVVSCTGFTAGPGSQLKIARAALAAGISRYFPWQFGVDYDTIGRGSAQDLFDEQLDVRDMLRAQTHMRWTIVSTGVFMSFLFEQLGLVEPVGEHRVIVRALGSWENQVTATTAEDIGRMTAEAIYDELDGVVFIAGDTIKYSRFAEIVGQVTGRQVTKEVWDVDLLLSRLRSAPNNPLAKYSVVFAEGRGVSWDLQTTHTFSKQIALQSAVDWAQKNLNL